jgi:hypothetical protein
MNKDFSVLDAYMNMTGQTVQEVFAGVECYGPDLLYNLLSKCLLENKKIVWKDKHFLTSIDANAFELVPVRSNIAPINNPDNLLINNIEQESIEPEIQRARMKLKILSDEIKKNILKSKKAQNRTVKN